MPSLNNLLKKENIQRDKLPESSHLVKLFNDVNLWDAELSSLDDLMKKRILVAIKLMPTSSNLSSEVWKVLKQLQTSCTIETNQTTRTPMQMGGDTFANKDVLVQTIWHLNLEYVYEQKMTEIEFYSENKSMHTRDGITKMSEVFKHHELLVVLQPFNSKERFQIIFSSGASLQADVYKMLRVVNRKSHYTLEIYISYPKMKQDYIAGKLVVPNGIATSLPAEYLPVPVGLSVEEALYASVKNPDPKDFIKIITSFNIPPIALLVANLKFFDTKDCKMLSLFVKKVVKENLVVIAYKFIDLFMQAIKEDPSEDFSKDVQALEMAVLLIQCGVKMNSTMRNLEANLFKKFDMPQQNAESKRTTKNKTSPAKLLVSTLAQAQIIKPGHTAKDSLRKATYLRGNSKEILTAEKLQNAYIFLIQLYEHPDSIKIRSEILYELAVFCKLMGYGPNAQLYAHMAACEGFDQQKVSKLLSDLTDEKLGINLKM